MHNPITPEWASTMGNPKLAETYVVLFDSLSASSLTDEERPLIEQSLGVIIGFILQRFVSMYCDFSDVPIPNFDRKQKDD